MTLNDLQGQRIASVEIDEGVAKLVFESGQWLSFNFRDVWCGKAEPSLLSPSLQEFLAEMKRRRVVQETQG